MKYILLIICCSFPFLSSAQLEVLQINSATAGACDGSIRVQAEGSAGPFDIFINESLSTQTQANQSEYFLGGLCPGTYTLEIKPSNYPVCGKVFEINVAEEGSGTGDVCVELVPNEGPFSEVTEAIQPGISVVPDFNGNIQVSITVDQSIPIKVELLDASNNIAYTLEQQLSVGKNDLPGISLSQYVQGAQDYFLKISSIHFSDRVYRISN